MLVSSRVLARATLVVGVGLMIPTPAIALAGPPTLCTDQQERDAEEKPDPVAVDKCGQLRVQSAEARRSSVPVSEDPEKITPFKLKTGQGVEPQTQQSLFGDAEFSDTGSVSAYENAAIRAAYYTGFYTAEKGGALYFDPVKVESASDPEPDKSLSNYLYKKSGGGTVDKHDDKTLPPKLLNAKTTAAAARARARLLAGEHPDMPESTESHGDDMEADMAADAAAEAEFRDTAPGDTVENRIKANKAEAAAVDAARAAGWPI
ncbi:hypothetical protein ACFWF7_05920 [Nocardia sp. NPDC060256]|uniref:hypothetical protein n=1 Tax=unclassified Nocardia TaxID=2637762 RepID=UPI00365CE528